MFVIKGKYGSCNYRNLSVKLIFACFIFCLLSCKKSASTFVSPAAYYKALDTANRMNDAGRKDQAKHYLDSVYFHSKKPDLLQTYKYYKFNYDYYNFAKSDKAKALLYADSMLNLFNSPDKQTKYTTEYGQAHFLKGDILFDQNKYYDAYEYFYKGEVVGKNSLDECLLSDYSYRMGMIMYKQEHYQLAAAYFKNGANEITACTLNFPTFYRSQELINNAGLSYSNINMLDSALYFFDKSLKYINKYQKQFNDRYQSLEVARGVVYGNQADVYIRLKKYDLAKTLLKKSIKINLRKGNDNQDAQYTELKLATLYNLQNQTDSLLLVLNVINQQFAQLNEPDAKAEWYRMMSVYFEEKNQHNEAIKYFAKYDAIKDSINKKTRALKETDIAEQTKRLEKDSEFDRLKKNNRQQNLYLTTTIVFVAMLALIILLMFLNWQKSKNNISTLGVLNNQVNEQNSKLERALDELKLNSQEKDRILRTVAHDLRNPIGGIASLTSVMSEDDYTDDQKEMLNLIKETSFNSLELINEILEAANTASVSLNKECVEINGLLAHSVELLKFKAAEKKQEIRLELPANPVELMISREKIWRVISNLISNAIKFSPVGSTILVKAENMANEIQIAVQDNGIGIPDKLKKQVFNMFTDAKRPGTEGEKSFGLGLSICQQIVEKHNGRIWFESDVEKGTTFYFSLPR
ncbi:MAG TPA: HAMP domain-containing sensor histidine kinase [Mucilaginibacter sp.]